MKNLKHIIITLLFSIPLEAGDFNFGEVNRTFNKSFSTNSDVSLILINSFGDVKVKSGNENKVEISVMIKVSSNRKSEADLKSFLENIEIKISDKPSEIVVETIYPETRMNNMSFSTEYVITVPNKASVDVENSFGNADITNIGGKVNLNLSHGDVRLSDNSGENNVICKFGKVEARRLGLTKIDASNGDVKVDAVNGNLTIKNKFGRIKITDVKGNLKVDGGNGDLDAVNISGTAILNNSFGYTSVENIGGWLEIESQNGDITAAQISGAEIYTSFGRVKVENVKGSAESNKLTINNQNGDVLLKSIKADVNVKNSFAYNKFMNITGNLTVKSQNSSIDVVSVSGDMDIQNTFGAVDITESSGSISVSNQNGDVVVDEIKKTGKNYNISTSFGIIKFYVPSNISAKVYGETSFGSIDTNFDLKIKDRFNKSTMEGKIGSGSESTINLTTQNASIIFDKRK